MFMYFEPSASLANSSYRICEPSCQPAASALASQSASTTGRQADGQTGARFGGNGAGRVTLGFREKAGQVGLDRRRRFQIDANPQLLFTRSCYSERLIIVVFV